MGEAKRREDEQRAALAAIAAGTLLLVRPEDKVIVRVMANIPHADFMRLHETCTRFFGEQKFLLVPGTVEFMMARSEDAQVVGQEVSDGD